MDVIVLVNTPSTLSHIRRPTMWCHRLRMNHTFIPFKGDYVRIHTPGMIMFKVTNRTYEERTDNWYLHCEPVSTHDMSDYPLKEADMEKLTFQLLSESKYIV